MPAVYLDNPSPQPGVGGPVVYLWYDPSADTDIVLSDIRKAIAGHNEFAGHASGAPGVIEQPPTQVAADDDFMAQSLARMFTVPEGKIGTDNQPMQASTCEVVPVAQLAETYQTINSDVAEQSVVDTVAEAQAAQTDADEPTLEQTAADAAPLDVSEAHSDAETQS